MNEQEMMADLASADASGDTRLAQAIAGRIRAARTAAPAVAPPVGTAHAAVLGGLQGMTGGFGDEMEAGWKSLFPKSMGGSDYRTTRDSLRAENAAAKAQHPVAYGVSDAAGGILPTAAAAMATGGTSLAPSLAKAALPLAAGQGALQGAGYSDANSPGAVARDSAIGGGVGTLGYGLGSVLGKASGAVAGWARGKATQAVAKAGEQAAGEVAGNISAAKGALGAEVQKGSRYVENLMRLEQTMTPQQKALYASLHPEVEQLQQRVAQSTLDALPSQAGEIATRDAELQTLKSGASQALAARKAELLQPQFGKDAASLVKSYGEPVLAAALAPPGMKEAAGLIFGRTRAGKAIASRITRPGNQKAMADFIANRAEGPTATFLRLALSRGAPAAVTDQLVTQ